MSSSGMSCRAAFVRTDVSKDVSPPLFTLMMEAIHSSETSVTTRVIRRQILEDGIFQDIPLSTLMMEAIPSSETLIITGAKRRYIPDDGILQYMYNVVVKVPIYIYIFTI
jgi:hypothetical protein